MTHTHRRLFFQLFLIIYGGFLLLHIWEMGFGSWQMFGALLGGLSVALLAHKRHGYLPSLFLVGHMIIEWYHHALHGSHYNGSEITFHGIHALLDMVFLYVEAKAHYGKFARYITIGALVTLTVTFVYYYIPAPHSETWSGVIQENHFHSEGVLSSVVVGGILGCILSHLFSKTKTK